MKSIRYDHSPGSVPPELAAVPFFARLRPDCLDEVLDGVTVLEAEPGEAVVSEGDRTHALYFLIDGQLRVEKGSRGVADLSKPGTLFGEIAFVVDKPHGATVRAAGAPATVLKLDRAITRALSDAQIDHFEGVLYRFLTELLAARLDETTGRVARPLSGLQDDGGQPERYKL